MAVVVGGSHWNVEVKSTAMHETSDEHETDSRGTPGSMSSGDDQRPEPYVSASPSKSTATQNLVVGQEIDVNPPPRGSIVPGGNQVLPS